MTDGMAYFAIAVIYARKMFVKLTPGHLVCAATPPQAGPKIIKLFATVSYEC
jgi:hypothetical protein